MGQFKFMNIDYKEREKAISYLVESVNSLGHNPKPIILHSLKMAIFLLNYGYNQNIVIVAILHDLLEDTNITYSNIKENFGGKIADMVKVLSFDISIKGKKEREKVGIDKTIDYGKEVMVVKAADFIDNSYFYYLAKGEIAYKWLIEKFKYFVEKSRDYLKDEPIWENLTARLESVSKQGNFNQKNN